MGNYQIIRAICGSEKVSFCRLNAWDGTGEIRFPEKVKFVFILKSFFKKKCIRDFNPDNIGGIADVKNVDWFYSIPILVNNERNTVKFFEIDFQFIAC